MISTTIHGVKSIELTQIICSEISSGIYFRRKLIITDEQGHKTEITLFADTEEPLEIKEEV
jgi:hypothetical protein